MSVMERRLQLLLDAERFARVSEEAERSGRSVAAVIREAIDVRFPGEDERVRIEAGQELRDRARRSRDEATGTAPGPHELKQAYASPLETILDPR
ncbi:MAG: antitoxin [Arsenicicoccus sp.]|nr:MAG: antitoxin [Arsenicicoccus sp.]